jgi:hypothetical protein
VELAIADRGERGSEEKKNQIRSRAASPRVMRLSAVRQRQGVRSPLGRLRKVVDRRYRKVVGTESVAVAYP